MNNKQRTVLALGGIALMATAGIASQSVFAKTPSDTLASSLATKLNLEESTVSTALDSVRSEKEAERSAAMKTSYTEKLTTAVAAGKLTEAQKTQLLTKYDEVKTKKDEIRKQMESLKTETEAWAKTNNIDTEYLMGGGGKDGGEKGGRGHGGPGGPGMMR